MEEPLGETQREQRKATRRGGGLKWCLRPESNRHALRPGIFFPLRLSPPAAFRAGKSRRSWAGARLRPGLAALGARRLLSTPSCAGRLGSALAGHGAGAFAEFDGFHSGRFRAEAQIVSSPLCLPISPLRLFFRKSAAQPSERAFSAPSFIAIGPSENCAERLFNPIKFAPVFASFWLTVRALLNPPLGGWRLLPL